MSERERERSEREREIENEGERERERESTTAYVSPSDCVERGMWHKCEELRLGLPLITPGEAFPLSALPASCGAGD